MKMFNYDIPNNDRLVVFANSKEEADKMVLKKYKDAFDENWCDENGTKISDYESCGYEIPTEPAIHVCVSW